MYAHGVIAGDARRLLASCVKWTRRSRRWEEETAGKCGGGGGRTTSVMDPQHRLKEEASALALPIISHAVDIAPLRTHCGSARTEQKTLSARPTSPACCPLGQDTAAHQIRHIHGAAYGPPHQRPARHLSAHVLSERHRHYTSARAHRRKPLALLHLLLRPHQYPKARFRR